MSSTPSDKSNTTNNKAVPFRRVVTEKVEVDPRLKDNSFEAKVNAPKISKPRQLYLITKLLFFVMQRSFVACDFGHLLLCRLVVT